MKNIIIYSTKYGSVKKCAELLKSKLKDETIIFDTKEKSSPDISNFDNIILGGSIYAGRMQSSLKKFIEKNINVLLQKNVALFSCSGAQDTEGESYIKNNFPEELYNHAVAKELFGSELFFNMLNPLEKFAIKMITKSTDDVKNIKEENIEKLAKKINDLK